MTKKRVFALIGLTHLSVWYAAMRTASHIFNTYYSSSDPVVPVHIRALFTITELMAFFLNPLCLIGQSHPLFFPSEFLAAIVWAAIITVLWARHRSRIQLKGSTQPALPE